MGGILGYRELRCRDGHHVILHFSPNDTPSQLHLLLWMWFLQQLPARKVKVLIHTVQRLVREDRGRTGADQGTTCNNDEEPAHRFFPPGVCSRVPHAKAPRSAVGPALTTRITSDNKSCVPSARSMNSAELLCIAKLLHSHGL